MAAPTLDLAPPLDWARVAQWTRHLIDGDLAPIDAVFASHGATPPEIAWQPVAAQLSPAPLRFLAAHWAQLPRRADLPHVRQIDALQLGPALGCIMLLDAIDGGRDFRYRLYGTIVTRISRFDMTGRLLSQHPASSYVAEFGLAASRAALQRRQALYTARAPVGAEETATWHRLALPLIDDTGAVVRLIAGAAAVRGDGRMVL